jgi:hypothetical protein
MTIQRYHLAGATWEAASPPDTPLFLAGPQLYTLTTVGGAVRPFGEWHLPGNMGGVWSHPLRALHGWSLALARNSTTYALDSAIACDLHGSHATRHFNIESLTVNWTEFAAQDAPALLSVIAIRNDGGAAWAGTLTLRVEAELRGPWFGGWEAAQTQVEPTGTLRITAANGPYVGRAVAVAASQPGEWRSAGDSARVTLPITLAPGETHSLAFALLVAHTTHETVAERAQALAANANKLLADTIAAYEHLNAASTLETRDPLLNAGWSIARQNLQMLTASYPDLPTYLLAGLPEYPQLFGCDTTYTVPGALAGGFAPVVTSALNALAVYGERACGRIPHEITTNGRVYHPGNTQETPQFAVACWDHLRWTGDLDHARRMYPLCAEGLEHFAGTLAGGHYPLGDGMVERLGMGACKLDSVCYLYQALDALRELARAIGRDAEADAYAEHAARLAERFERDWWLEVESLYADSLQLDGRPQLDGHWTIALPAQVGIASAERARRTLNRIEREWVNEWGLVHTRGTEEHVWTLPTGLLALAAFAYDRPELGVKLLGSIAETARHGTLGTLKELIPIGLCFIQLWSAGLLLQGVVEGLFGVAPRAHRGEVDIAPRLPAGWSDVQLRGLPVGAHTLDLLAGPDTLELGHAAGPRPLNIRYRPHGQDEWIEALVGPGETVLLMRSADLQGS